MTGASWVPDAVFYQIFPERFANGDRSNDPPGVASWTKDAPTRENFFGGDLEGIRQKLTHIRRLGANTLYTTPIFAAGSNHKYDTHDYLKIDPIFGTLDSFRALVRDLKASDMRLLLDGVFNHCGDGFWAFRDVVEKGAESPYAGWFIVDSYPIRFDPPSFQTCGGAPFLPRLNTDNPEVRAYLMQVVDRWMAEGIDGWRLDVPWKASPTLWPEFFQRVLSHNDDAYVVAEVWRGTRDWLGGDRAHGVMNYRLRQNILDYAAFNHQDAEDFDYELHQLLAEHGATASHHLTLLGSHDTPRILTLCGGDVGRAVIAIALQMTLPGVPMVYYGDEIGMEGGNDPDCRRPMIWDESRWCWPIWDATRALIALRHQSAAIRQGELRTLRVFNGVYAYARVHADEPPVVVVLNPRDAQPKLTIPLGDLSNQAEWIDVLTGTRFNGSGGTITFEPLAPQSAHVLVPAEGAWQE